MTISLKKHETAKISLTKRKDGLEQVSIGLGWDPARAGTNIDLDASIIVLSNSRKNDIIYYGNLSNRNKSIVHSGDNLTGDGDGDDELITVKLSELPANVDELFVTISSYRGQTFGQISKAECNLYDDSKTVVQEVKSSSFFGKMFNATTTKEVKEKIITLNMSKTPEGENKTGLVVGRLIKRQGYWDFQAIQEYVYAKTPGDLIDYVEKYSATNK